MQIWKNVCLEFNTEVRISAEWENKRKMCILMARVAFKEVNISCNVMQKWKKALLTLSGFLCYSYSILFCTSTKGKQNVYSFKCYQPQKTKTQTKPKQKYPHQNTHKKNLSSIKHIFKTFHKVLFFISTKIWWKIFGANRKATSDVHYPAGILDQLYNNY